MSRLDDLPPDQRATLSLLLSQRKSYAEVAALLSIPERAVHDRAQAALAVLAPAQARELTAERRAEVGNYLLGQQPGVAERLATRTYLEGSAPARAWAHAQSPAEIAPARAALRCLRFPRPRAAAPAPDPLQPRLRSHRRREPSAQRGARRTGRARGSRGTAQLAARRRAAAAAPSSRLVIVAVDADRGRWRRQARTSKTPPPPGRARRPRRPRTTGAKPAAHRRAARPKTSASRSRSPEPGEQSRRASWRSSPKAANTPSTWPPSTCRPTHGFFYAVWLYNSPTSHEALSKSPPVGSSGTLQGGALLPANAGEYHTMLLTRETTDRPSHPGPIVLSGPFSLGLTRAISSLPGFMIPAGSSSAFSARSAATPVAPTSRAIHGAWSRPTAWWWVIVPPPSEIARLAASLTARH